jgi:class 3 adenylate cyclase
MKPRTRYAKSGNLHIAYQVVGEGAVDMVYVPGWVSHIDMVWDDPKMSDFLLKLTQFSRLILFDKRGTGLSDRVSELSTLEERMDDICTVMDAAGSEKAVIFGHSEGGTVSCLFAATYPHRTEALITFGVFAKRLYSDVYPWAPKVEEREEFYRNIEEEWGNGATMGLEKIMPSLADNRQYCDWFASYLRSAASPGAALALARMNSEADIINILSTITVPALVIHRTDDTDASVEEGKFIANRIPNARFVELPGSDHVFWAGDTYSVLAEIGEFVTGVRPPKEFQRFLATILFTDIVDSTKHLSDKGDRKWIDILVAHNRIVRKQLDIYNGKEIKITGDGFLATFDGPSKAIRCAGAIREELLQLGIEITAGIHTGECEVLDTDDIGGIAVHIASRVMDKASPGQILITMTVKYLLGGTGLEFTDIGEYNLRGIDEPYRLYALKSSGKRLY